MPRRYPGRSLKCRSLICCVRQYWPSRRSVLSLCCRLPTLQRAVDLAAAEGFVAVASTAVVSMVGVAGVAVAGVDPRSVSAWAWVLPARMEPTAVMADTAMAIPRATATAVTMAVTSAAVGYGQ